MANLGDANNGEFSPPRVKAGVPYDFQIEFIEKGFLREANYTAALRWCDSLLAQLSTMPDNAERLRQRYRLAECQPQAFAAGLVDRRLSAVRHQDFESALSGRNCRRAGPPQLRKRRSRLARSGSRFPTLPPQQEQL